MVNDIFKTAKLLLLSIIFVGSPIAYVALSFIHPFFLSFLQSLNTVFTLLFLTTAIKSDENGAYFKIEENQLFFRGNESSVWIGKAVSLLSCSQMCARREDCQSANFIKEQQTCSLFSEGPSYLTGLLKRDGCFYMEKVGKGR